MQPMLIVAAIAGALVGAYLLIASPFNSSDDMVHDTSDLEMAGTCEDPLARQFDFWVGQWNLTWEGGQGNNAVRSIMGGCVIEGNFSFPDGEYFGKSFSTYVPVQGVWKQTWVDNNGVYLDFIGKMEDDQMVFQRQFTNVEDQLVMQRIRFFDIEKDRMEWVWERSMDEGQTWNILWQIHYERRN